MTSEPWLVVLRWWRLVLRAVRQDDKDDDDEEVEAFDNPEVVPEELCEDPVVVAWEAVVTVGRRRERNMLRCAFRRSGTKVDARGLLAGEVPMSVPPPPLPVLFRTRIKLQLWTWSVKASMASSDAAKPCPPSPSLSPAPDPKSLSSEAVVSA